MVLLTKVIHVREWDAGSRLQYGTMKIPHCATSHWLDDSLDALEWQDVRISIDPESTFFPRTCAETRSCKWYTLFVLK